MKNLLRRRPVLFALLALLLPGTLLAAPRKKNRKPKQHLQTETPRPDTVYIIKYVAAPDTVGRPSLDDRTPVAYTPQVRDSLLSDWYARNIVASYDEFFDAYVLDTTLNLPHDATPDSVYAQRLRAIVSPVHLPYNPIVKDYIARYTRPDGLMSRILGLAHYYFPLVEEELIKAGLPVELRALPIIESALLPTAVSRMGAAGIWQFMPATGKIYGMEINSLVDERYDPAVATRAACRYLKDMYALFGDWTLAIAAYNCGAGNVNKAIARAGGSARSFWDIYDYLPRETRGYVPAFIGATYAFAYHRQHGIESAPAPLPLAVDTIRIGRITHLGQISSTLDLPIEILRQLNPQYRLDIIPATNRDYTLVLPQQYASRYIADEAAIRAKDSVYLKEYLDPANIDKKRASAAGTFTIHVVKSGETLGGIARRYRISQQTIMRDNNIRNANRLSLGQRLKIRRR